MVDPTVIYHEVWRQYKVIDDDGYMDTVYSRIECKMGKIKRPWRCVSVHFKEQLSDIFSKMYRAFRNFSRRHSGALENHSKDNTAFYELSHFADKVSEA